MPISASFGIAAIILGEGGLAFIGLGDASVPSWGVLLGGRATKSALRLSDLGTVLVFLALVMSLNMIGNGLREAFDPRSASQ